MVRTTKLKKKRRAQKPRQRRNRRNWSNDGGLASDAVQVLKMLKNGKSTGGMGRQITRHLRQVGKAAVDFGKSAVRDIEAAADGIFAQTGETVEAAAPAAVGYRIVAGGNARTAATRITHKDVLDAHVTVSNTFAFSEYIMNPGNNITFPWLAPLARRFELFEIDDLCFHYTPTASTSENGTVALYWEPDWNDPVPTDMSSMLNSEFVAGGSAWLSHSLRIPKRMFSPRNTNAKRVRTDNTADTERESHDAGRFFVVSEGGSGSQDIGILSVSYTFRFRVPQFHHNGDGFLHLRNFIPLASSNCDDTFLGATAGASSNLQNRGVKWGVAGGALDDRTITFPAGLRGSYLLLIQYSADTIGPNLFSNNPMGVVGGVTRHANFLNQAGDTSLISSDDGTASRATVLMVDFHLDGSAGSITVCDQGVIKTGDCNIDMFIFQMPAVHDYSKILNQLRDEAKMLGARTMRVASAAIKELKEKETPLYSVPKAPPVLERSETKAPQFKTEDIEDIGTQEWVKLIKQKQKEQQQQLLNKIQTNHTQCK